MRNLAAFGAQDIGFADIEMQFGLVGDNGIAPVGAGLDLALRGGGRKGDLEFTALGLKNHGIAKCVHPRERNCEN